MQQFPISKNQTQTHPTHCVGCVWVFGDIPGTVTMILGGFTIAVYVVYVALVFGMWNRVFTGTDEITFAYYANYLLVHGINPYTTNMDAIINQHPQPNTPNTLCWVCLGVGVRTHHCV